MEEQHEITVAETQYGHMLDVICAEADSLTASMLDVLRRESAFESMLEMHSRCTKRMSSPNDFASTEGKRKDSWRQLIELLVTMSDFMDQFTSSYTGFRTYMLDDETEADGNKVPDEPRAKEDAPTIGFAV